MIDQRVVYAVQRTSGRPYPTTLTAAVAAAAAAADGWGSGGHSVVDCNVFACVCCVCVAKVRMLPYGAAAKAHTLAHTRHPGVALAVTYV